MLNQINPNGDRYYTLKFIKQFYDVNKSGCQSATIISNPKILRFLVKQNLLFKTDKGYFPTTEGQEFVEATEQKIKARGTFFRKVGIKHRENKPTIKGVGKNNCQ